MLAVGQSLKPGNAAVVAEVWEEWMLPVDSRMEALGGVVFRRTRSDVLDQQVEADITSLKADIDALEAEYSQANAEAKTKIQAKINKANAMLQTKLEGIKARLETSQKETEAKIQSLQGQAIKAGGERKAKLKKRIAELQSEQKRRGDLLKQAGELIKDALTV